MANISDHKSMVNIAPFGKCRSLANPVVAAATAAHHGHLTPMPCIPNTPQPWMLGKTNVIEKGNAALKKDCKLRCMWAGIISINTDGQSGEGVHPIYKHSNKLSSRMSDGKEESTLKMAEDSNQNIYTTNDTSVFNDNSFVNNNPVINNPILNNNITIITAEEAETKLPNFSNYSESEQEIILKIANNSLLNNANSQIDDKDARLKSAERHMLFNLIPGLPKKITKQQVVAITNNNIELEKMLNIKKGYPMSVADADKQNANPRYGSNDKYGNNCVTTTATYLMRLRGFNVTANPRGQKHTDYLSEHRFDMWKNSDGTTVKPTNANSWMKEKGYKEMNTDRYLEFFNESCKETGVYQLSINWEKGGGHSTILQRFPNGELRYIEPQVDFSSNTSRDIKYLAQNGAKIPVGERGILRIDDKIFNTEYADIFQTQ